MSAVGGPNKLDYSKTPLPDPPVTKFSPQPPKPVVTKNIKKIAERIRRDSTPHHTKFSSVTRPNTAQPPVKK